MAAERNGQAKWQEAWYDSHAFETEPDRKKPKYYMLFAYPTVSGTLHIGHTRSYTIPDIIARYKRARGFNVFFPLGFHATGGDCTKICEISKSHPEELTKYGIPKELIKNFNDPLDIASYLQGKMIEDFKRLGLSLDFRPVISTIDPKYGKFIQWQFRKLKEKGYLIQRDHRLAWCPVEGHPVSLDPAEADVQEWKGAQIKDYTIIKFRAGKLVLPAATMRPETIFGVTNIWVNPKGKYVRAKVDGEEWLISKEAVKKLQDLEKKIEIIKEVKGTDVLKLTAKNPANGTDVPVLPGDFVDLSEATGVVMSVPSHDPFDFIYLRKISPQTKPIHVVEITGHGEAPAGELLEKHGITDPKDPRIEEVVKELYKMEFGGRMLANIPKFGGLPVSKAKGQIASWLKERDSADSIHEMSVKPVHCRCGAEIIIKKVRGQWFLDYGNQQLKETAKKHIEKMSIFPPDYKNELPGIIDWLEARPCVRRRGLGTPFPFEKGWVIEALSDSTIYMAFFIVSKWLNGGKLTAEELTDEMFDFVFLGKGKPKAKNWQALRDEFLYWYPLDLNMGGKEHKTVHFPFFIMNHAAIFPEQLGPLGVFVNWHLIAYGKKMSKHVGNVVFWNDAIDKWGADAVRFYISHGANQWMDFDWTNEAADRYAEKLNEFNRMVEALLAKKTNKTTELDRWMTSRPNHTINDITVAMEKNEIRKALDLAFFGVMNDLNWYIKRACSCNIDAILSTWLKLLAPFIPHTAEEWWARLGNKEFIHKAGWPAYDGSKVHIELEAGECLLRQILADIGEIRKISKIVKPSCITLVAAQPWKYEMYNNVMQGKKLPELMKIQKYRELGQRAVDYANRLFKRGHLDELFLDAGKEWTTLREAQGFLTRETGSKVELLKADDVLNQKSPKTGTDKKAAAAEPGKPGILIE